MSSEDPLAAAQLLGLMRSAAIPAASTPAPTLPPVRNAQPSPAGSAPVPPFLYDPKRQRRQPASSNTGKRKGGAGMGSSQKASSSEGPDTDAADRFAWVTSAIAAMPERSRERAARVIAWAIGADSDPAFVAARDAKLPVTPVATEQWARQLFSLTPPARRKATAKDFAVMSHPDQGGSDDLFVAIQTVAKRFGAQR